MAFKIHLDLIFSLSVNVVIYFMCSSTYNHNPKYKHNDKNYFPTTVKEPAISILIHKRNIMVHINKKENI